MLLNKVETVDQIGADELSALQNRVENWILNHNHFSTKAHPELSVLLETLTITYDENDFPVLSPTISDENFLSTYVASSTSYSISDGIVPPDGSYSSLTIKDSNNAVISLFNNVNIYQKSTYLEIQTSSFTYQLEYGKIDSYTVSVSNNLIIVLRATSTISGTIPARAVSAGNVLMSLNQQPITAHLESTTLHRTVLDKPHVIPDDAVDFACGFLEIKGGDHRIFWAPQVYLHYQNTISNLYIIHDDKNRLVSSEKRVGLLPLDSLFVGESQGLDWLPSESGIYRFVEADILKSKIEEGQHYEISYYEAPTRAYTRTTEVLDKEKSYNTTQRPQVDSQNRPLYRYQYEMYLVYVAGDELKISTGSSPIARYYKSFRPPIDLTGAKRYIEQSSIELFDQPDIIISSYTADEALKIRGEGKGGPFYEVRLIAEEPLMKEFTSLGSAQFGSKTINFEGMKYDIFRTPHKHLGSYLYQENAGSKHLLRSATRRTSDYSTYRLSENGIKVLCSLKQNGIYNEENSNIFYNSPYDDPKSFGISAVLDGGNKNVSYSTAVYPIVCQDAEGYFVALYSVATGKLLTGTEASEYINVGSTIAVLHDGVDLIQTVLGTVGKIKEESCDISLHTESSIGKILLVEDYNLSEIMKDFGSTPVGYPSSITSVSMGMGTVLGGVYYDRISSNLDMRRAV